MTDNLDELMQYLTFALGDVKPDMTFFKINKYNSVWLVCWIRDNKDNSRGTKYTITITRNGKRLTMFIYDSSYCSRATSLIFIKNHYEQIKPAINRTNRIKSIIE